MQKDWNAWKGDIDEKITRQNSQIENHLKNEQDSIDFHVGFLEVFLAFALGITVFFSYRFRKEAKEEMEQLKSEIAERKKHYEEILDAMKIRLGESEKILSKVEETTLKAKAHESTLAKTIDDFMILDPEKKFTEEQRRALQQTVDLAKQDFANTGMEALKNVLKAKGIQAHDEERYVDCIRIFTNYLDLFTGEAIIYHRRGRSYSFLNDSTKAEKNYDIALSIDNKFAWAYHGKGFVANERGENEKAIEWYKKAIDCEPNFLLSWQNLATIYNNSNEFDKARECSQMVVKLNKNDDNGWNNLGVAYHGKGNLSSDIEAKQFYKEAEMCYLKALEFDPEREL